MIRPSRSTFELLRPRGAPRPLPRRLRLSLLLRWLLPKDGRSRRLIGHRVDLTSSEIEAPHLREGEWTRTKPSEDRDLVAALVHGSVAIEPL
jgi:hypothetical protein